MLMFDHGIQANALRSAKTAAPWILFKKDGIG